MRDVTTEIAGSFAQIAIANADERGLSDHSLVLSVNGFYVEMRRSSYIQDYTASDQQIEPPTY